jgi:hypothetical protein
LLPLLVDVAHLGPPLLNGRLQYLSRRKEEGGRRKEEGGRRKEEGGRRKEV